MTSARDMVAEDLEDADEITEALACLMLDEADLPPNNHAGAKCKCCGYYVEPTHDSVDCAFKLAAERDSLRALVRAFLIWGLSDRVACDLEATDELAALWERTEKLGVDVKDLEP